MLIEHSGDLKFFHDAVLYQLTHAGADREEEYDWTQIFYVAQGLAGEPDPEMRQAMYSAFNRLGFGTAGVSAASSLINLYGLEGFIFAVGRFDISSPEDDWWTVGSLIADLEDQFGKEEAKGLITSAVASDKTMEKVIGAYRLYEEGREQAKKQADSEQIDLATLASMPGEHSWAWEFRRWAIKATSEELVVAANQFL